VFYVYKWWGEGGVGWGWGGGGGGCVGGGGGGGLAVLDLAVERLAGGVITVML